MNDDRDEDLPMVYFGGVKDGERVEIIGGLPPAKMKLPDAPGGWYCWSDERQTYVWRPDTPAIE